jgi:hypothetical protein
MHLLFYSFGNKTTAILDSSVRKYPNNNGNHKEVSDEDLVRSFVEDQDEETFNEVVSRYGDKIYRIAYRYHP